MTVQIHDNEMKVWVNGQCLIHHTPANPWLFAGNGVGKFEMFHGNFTINDGLNTKIPLTLCQIIQNDEKNVVLFSHEGFPAVEVTFIESENSIELIFAPNGVFNRLWLRIAAEAKEHVYGCGEQYSNFDLRGRDFPLWVSEHGVGRNKKTYVTFMADALGGGAGGDYYTTYFPQPTFVSSRCYFCHVDDSSYMRFDFRDPDFHELEVWGIPKKLILAGAMDFPELLQGLTDQLGRQPELPKWVNDGVILGVQGGTTTALEKVEKALAAGVKVVGLWIQDWEGKRITSFGKRLMWNWEWDRALYPGLDTEIKRLRMQGIRVLGYLNPYLAVEGALFKQAQDGGYLVNNPNGEDYILDFGEFQAGTVDLTNPQAFAWFKRIIQENLIGLGLGGWMADFAEYLPTDAVLYSGESAEYVHNQWPVLWARLNREAVEEAGQLGEILFFMRSGYSGSQKYSTMSWAGDQNVDWSLDDGLPSVIPAALSLGLSGYGLHHSDIGGYTTLFELKRSKELFMRWTELATFSPLMRMHEGNRPEENWQFDGDEETLQSLARLSMIFVALAPYLRQAISDNSRLGLPVMRPLFLHYPAEDRTYDIGYEYLLGRDLLVAPVCESGAMQWQTYLPEDEWIHLWSGKEYSGGDVEVEAPVGYPPVFYRKLSPYADLFKEVGRS